MIHQLKIEAYYCHLLFTSLFKICALYKRYIAEN